MGNFDQPQNMHNDLSEVESRSQTPFPQHSKDRSAASRFDETKNDNSVSPVSGFQGLETTGTSVHHFNLNRGLHTDKASDLGETSEHRKAVKLQERLAKR